MQMFEKKIERYVKEIEQELFIISDKIHDYAEIGYEEYQSSACLAEYLKEKGFEVTKPYAGLETAFSAKVLTEGEKERKITIGFLCEYDALKNQGHGCAHHMQGPAMAGAALALWKIAREEKIACEIRVIGTPAEETLDGGKTTMEKNKGFEGLDLVFMVHGGECTQLDSPSLALIESDITFHGISSHVGIAPDEGRSALDAAVLAGTGLGLLRGHVKDGTRINHIVLNGGFVVNSVPEYAKVKLEVRYSNMGYLDQVYERAIKVMEGAAVATETSYEVEQIAYLHNTKINHSLGKVVMECARDYGCEDIRRPREAVGSTDFGIVTKKVPSCCLRVKTIDENFPPHTKEWVNAGKSDRNYQGIEDGAKCCAAAAYRLLTDKNVWENVKKEHEGEE
jgi:aminobenzoyl-glutamate utilization protein B